MPAPQFIEGKPVIKYEEQYKQSAVITAGTNDTRQSTITIQRGMRAFIIRLSQAWDAGLHLLARGNLLLLAPPLIVEPAQIEEAVTKLDGVLEWVDRNAV